MRAAALVAALVAPLVGGRAVADDRALAPSPGPGLEAVEATRAAGESRLMDLCLTSPVEDAWIFFERGGVGSWLDVGRDEGPDEVRIDVPFEDLDGVDRLTVYHIHPVVADLERAARRHRPLAHGSAERYRRILVERTPGLFARPPGRADVAADRALRRLGAGRGVAVTSRVVCAAGLYEHGGEAEIDLAAAWTFLDFEGYLEPGGRQRLTAAFAALGLVLVYEPRRDLLESDLLLERLDDALRRLAPAWNPQWSR